MNAETALEEVLRNSYPWCAGWAAELRQLFAAYVEAKQRQNVLDYDDLLLYWAQMVAEPSIAAELGGRFKPGSPVSRLRRHLATMDGVFEARRPNRSKAMPVILNAPEEYETCLTAPAEVALKLQWPLPDDMLEIVAEGARSDQPEDGRTAARSHA